ncbi:hypothetical protein J416_12237 [Gracilibacillus halophilus YIM-C55.5]|uniref:DUF4015 domain-containing protein n=1 Tax=Gracilibacillus halophilus YIM-C55.5 TaxID=1308866 RepID=N4WJ53_9BACI|nr:putative glycoside hydrolase [Gracilibacillus halophilus]ENH96177.1 hypothetical protein J416_12237 [Gracilibacillus halophilus YIM-C55.5]
MRQSRQWIKIAAVFLLLTMIWLPKSIHADEESSTKKTIAFHEHREVVPQKLEIPSTIPRFTYQTGYQFEYPEAVRGIYVTGPTVSVDRFDNLLKYVDDTELNSMVIDIKEDHGNLTLKVDEDSPYKDIAQGYIQDPEKLLSTLEEKGIYPIARIVVFKDSVLAHKRPDLSFTKNGEVWTNGKGEAFVSPFQKEVWEYNLKIAKMAAKLGFKDIQFDYVRFPEGFEKRDTELNYDQGDYKDVEMNSVKKRVEAVTDFVHYAKNEMSNFDVDVSVDIFGYSATIEEAPGIGQNFSRISKNVDVISSMIYPSHWTPYFGIDKPDTEPYKLVSEYAKVENKVLSQLDEPPVSRPWIQDFEAPWLYSGSAFEYGVEEVEAQIKALNEHGIEEFLIWNPVNDYTEGVDYTPLD